jgi:hypothetical protein
MVMMTKMFLAEMVYDDSQDNDENSGKGNRRRWRRLR